METGWRNSNSNSFDHTTNFTNNAWDHNHHHIWDNITTPYHNNYSTNPDSTSPGTVVHGFLLGVTTTDTTIINRRTPEPHMMCLKLGKRHYYEDTIVDVPTAAAESSTTSTKRSGKLPEPPYPYYMTTDTSSTTTAAATTATVWPAAAARVRSSSLEVPRCQVEGCHVALGNVKEYYRRHKVCELHSKAPKVVVLGLQQRFCQQCSRFHGVTEFDEAKRSCRRRLKGHNQRRRKGTLLQRNFPPHSHEPKSSMMEPRLPLSPPSSTQTKPGCALSLLSSPETEQWNSTGDLASRCSAALHELIAANRASSVLGHFFNQNTYQRHQDSDAVSDNATTHMSADTETWDRIGHSQSQASSSTLDLQQAPALEFGLLSMKEKSKEPEEWTDYCWSSFGGANVV